jgi:hypothetical protein
MKNQFIKSAVGIGLGFFAGVAPGYCSAFPTLAFSGGAGGATPSIVESGNTAGAFVSSFEVAISSLMVSNANASAEGLYSITYGELIYTGTATTGTLSLILETGGSFTGGGVGGTGGNGNLDLANLAANQTLLSWAISGGIKFSSVTGVGDTFSTTSSPNTTTVNFGASTTLSESAALIADLGPTAGGGANISGAAIGGNGSGNTYTPSSTNLTAVLTPEPASFLLLGSGFLALAFFGRKRLTQS